jgi:hypothetical protein
VRELRSPPSLFPTSLPGEHYSGRFALMPYVTNPPPNITSTLAGRKLPVRYNPRHPETWYLPDELIEGCKVEQKMGPHLIGFYPQDWRKSSAGAGLEISDTAISSS